MANFTDALELAQTSAPAGSHLRLFSPPSAYNDFIVLPFNYTSISIALDRTHLRASSITEPHRRESGPPPSKELLVLHGGIVQVSNPRNFTLTLRDVQLDTKERAQSALKACVWISSENRFEFQVSGVTAYCNVTIDSGPESRFSTSRSFFHGNLTSVTMDEDSTVDSYYSSFFASAWLLGNRSTVTWTASETRGNVSMNATGSHLMLSLTYCDLGAPFRAEILNQTKSAQFGLQMVSSYTANVFRAISPGLLNAHLLFNNHSNLLILNGTYLNANIYNSRFLAHQRSKNPRNQLAAGTLALHGSCINNVTVARNIFYNGTVFVIMALDSPLCADETPQLQSSIYYNRFPTPYVAYSFDWVLKQPATPALGFFPIPNLLPLDMAQTLFTLNATRNYWGSTTGPGICCNPVGEGGYSTNQVNASDWCIDPWCSFPTTGKILPTSCIVSGCKQRITKVERIIFGLFSALGFTTVLLGLIIISIKIKRSATMLKQLHLTRTDAADTCFQILLFGVFFACFGAFFNIGATVPLLHSTFNTGHSAHQQRMPLRAVVIMWAQIVACVFQLPFNGFLIFAIMIRKGDVWPRLHESLVTAAYVLNVALASIGFMLGFGWLFFSGLNNLFDMFYLTLWTPLTYLVLVPTALLVSTSLLIALPAYTVLSRVKHYDYAIINESIDARILPRLRTEPTLESAALRLRHWLIITCVSGILLLVITITDILRDSYATLRYATVIVESSIALGALCTAIYLTYAYYRSDLMVFILVIIIMAFFGAIQDIIFWSVYIAIGEGERRVSTTIHLGMTVLWSANLFNSILSLYRLRERALTLLPAAIAANLNDLLDRHWNHPFDRDTPNTTTSLTRLSYSIRPSLLRAIEDEGIDNDDDDDDKRDTQIYATGLTETSAWSSGKPQTILDSASDFSDGESVSSSYGH